MASDMLFRSKTNTTNSLEYIVQFTFEMRPSRVRLVNGVLYEAEQPTGGEAPSPVGPVAPDNVSDTDHAEVHEVISMLEAAA